MEIIRVGERVNWLLEGESGTVVFVANTDEWIVAVVKLDGGGFKSFTHDPHVLLPECDPDDPII
jgi:hypothetical protein